MKIVLFLCVWCIYGFGANLDFSFYKKDSKKEGNTLLVIGGIHGNEPGGYFAASFLEQYYDIEQGSLWIVPNLNFDSIILNRRGIYGDMNRKFSTIKQSDKDYKSVLKIKEIILNKKVDLVLNLHDGHGFYRTRYENAIFNPNAWGQATIIDQEKIHGLDKFGNLDEIATAVSEKLNSNILFENFHSFGVKNTQTKYKDEQQQLSLTYFAVTHNKPAFAIETSKNITDLTQKVIYQLKSIEEFMNIMDIKFKRKFDIKNYDEVKEKIFDFGRLRINNSINFDLNTLSRSIRFLPLKKDNNQFEFSHNLGAYYKDGKKYSIYIGNIKVSDIYAQYFDTQDSNQIIKIVVDGEEKEFFLSEEVEIKNNFKILKSDFRVNIIGFSKKGLHSEDGINVEKNDISSKYSIDKSSKKFRAEFYKDKKFCGMIILNFI